MAKTLENNDLSALYDRFVFTDSSHSSSAFGGKKATIWFTDGIGGDDTQVSELIVGHTLSFTNGEQISNATDGSITFLSTGTAAPLLLDIRATDGYDGGIIFTEGSTTRWSIQNDASDNSNYPLLFDYGTTTAGGATKLSLKSNGDLTIAGDLTVTGGDIDLSGEASQITLIDNTANALKIGSTGELAILSITTTDTSEQIVVQQTTGTSASLKLTGVHTLTDNLDDLNWCGLRIAPGILSGSYTVTRYNYISLNNNLLSSATITDACIFRFNAAAGSHKAVDSGSAHPDITNTDAWVKININDTVHYIPAYTDKS